MKERNWILMNTESKEFITFAEKELSACIVRLSLGISKQKAHSISKNIAKKVDWNNSALMHKGMSWIAKNYMVQNKMI